MPSLREVPLVCVLFAALGCHANAGLEPPTAGPASVAATAPTPAAQTRELALRYHLALEAFNRGAYEDAAHLFAQVLLDVPQDSTGDALRHLLIQHIGWAQLGAYDMSGDPTQLDVGEQVLERYLATHEALLPDAAGEREAIYELLGEYQIRRADQPSPDAHARLEALVEDTRTGFEQQLAASRPQVVDDGPIRVIEVETIPWAKFDDPQVRMFFAAPAGSLGGWMFDHAAGDLNPTRVLVRGRARAAEDRKHGLALIRAARPELEACYEQALVRGAELVERVELDLAWDAGALDDVELAGGHGFAREDASCVRVALRQAAALVPARPQARHSQLSLTFFVQFQQKGPSRADFGTDYTYPTDFDLGAGSGVQVQ